MTNGQHPPDEAAAELYVRALRQRGVIDTAWRPAGTSVVKATTHGAGIHLGNFDTDYDAGVHVVANTANMNLDTERNDHGPVFFNVHVRGIRDDATGNALPGHSAMTGEPSDDMDSGTRDLLEAAGYDFE